MTLLRAVDVNDLQLRRDEVEDFGDVFSDPPQRAATIEAANTEIEPEDLARHRRTGASERFLTVM